MDQTAPKNAEQTDVPTSGVGSSGDVALNLVSAIENQLAELRKLASEQNRKSAEQIVLQAELSRASAELAERESQASDQEAELATLRNQLAEREEQLEKTTEKLGSQDRDAKKLQQDLIHEIERLNKELHALQATHEAVREELEQARGRVTALEGELETLRTANSRQGEEMNSLRAEWTQKLSTAQSEAASMLQTSKVALETARRTTDQAQSQLSELTAQVQESTARQAAVEESLRAMSERAAKAEQACKDSETSAEGLLNDAVNAKAAKDASEAELAATRAALEKARTSESDAQQRVGALEEMTADLNHKLDEQLKIAERLADDLKRARQAEHDGASLRVRAEEAAVLEAASKELATKLAAAERAAAEAATKADEAQDKLQRLVEGRKALTEQLHGAAERAAAAERKHADSERSAEALLAEAMSSKSAREAAESALGKADAELVTLREQLNCRGGELIATADRASAAEHRATEAQRSLTALEARVKELSSHAESHAQRCKELEAQLRKAEASGHGHVEAASRAAEAERALAHLHEKLVETDRELRAALTAAESRTVTDTRKLAEATARAERAEDELRRLEEAAKAAAGRAGEASAAAQRTELLTAELTAVRAELELAQRELATLRERAELAELELSEAKELLQKADADAKRHSETTRASEAHLSTLTAALEAARAELATARRQSGTTTGQLGADHAAGVATGDLASQIEALKHMLADEQAELMATTRLLDQREEALRVLAERLLNGEERALSTDAELNNARAALAAAQEQLETLRESHQEELSKVRGGPRPIPSLGDEFNAQRRERLRNVRAALAVQTRKIVAAKAALERKNQQCEEVLTQRKTVAEGAAAIASERKQIDRLVARNKAGTFVFFAICSLIVIGAIAWQVGGHLVPATYAVRGSLRADIAGRELTREEMVAWTETHEKLVADPEVLSLAASRFAQRSMISLGNVAWLKQRLDKDLTIVPEAPGRLTLELRGEGRERTERELETFILAVAASANGSRDARGDGATTAISEPPRAGAEPIKDPRLATVLGVGGGGALLASLCIFLFYRATLSGKQKFENEMKMAENSL